MSTAFPPGVMPNNLSPTGHGPAGRRPGLVTAIGVTSIVVSGISLLACLLGGVWTLSMYSGARAVATASSGTNARAGTASPAMVLPSPDELEAESAARRATRLDRRSGLLDLFHDVRPLSPAARDQLDGMLARHAERVMPASLLSAAEVSTDDLRAQLASTGSLPPLQAGDAEGVFFQFRQTGRLEVFANRAVFKPADGSGAVRTAGPATAAEEDAVIAALPAPSAVAPAKPGVPEKTSDPTGPGDAPGRDGPETGVAPPPGVPPTPGVAPPTATPPPVWPGGGARIFPSGLTGQDVQSITQKAQAATGGKLNAGQLATLSNALQTRSPPLVKSQMAYSPIRLATVQPDGQAVVVFSDGMMVMDGAGTVVQQSSNDLQEVTIDPIGLTLMIGEAIAASAIAVFLLIAGILVLRNSPRAESFHWIFALLKLPLAVISAVSFAWVMRDVVSGVNRMSGAGTADSMTTVGIWLGVAGAVYPLVLLIVLCTPTVRAYFASERAQA